MAKIVLSDTAPSEHTRYVFPEGEVDVTGGSFETTDNALIASALSHPWLHVEYDPEVASVPHYRSTIDPKTDPLSAENPANFVSTDTQAAIDFENKRQSEEEQAAPEPTEVPVFEDAAPSPNTFSTSVFDDHTPEDNS